MKTLIDFLLSCYFAQMCRFDDKLWPCLGSLYLISYDEWGQDIVFLKNEMLLLALWNI